MNTFRENNHLISFAWEKGNDTETSLLLKTKLEEAKKLVSDTNILVIIGYSFPFFNRDIDKVVFDHIRSCHSLQKIYYQDPISKGEFLRSQFQLDDSIPIEHIQKVDNFFLPLEL